MKRVARILISGASGLIGSAIANSLETQGDHVIRLVRRPAKSTAELSWDPMQPIPPSLVSGFDAVIHLSGENIAGRWTAAKKRRIRDSRVISTQNLARALASAERKPHVFLCASAIGFYGDRGDEVLTEMSPAGSGFFPELCMEWEAATAPAAREGIRVATLRIGIVLSRQGGALKQMLLPFRLGFGGKIGSGRQWFSWIHVDDLVGAVQHVLRNGMQRVRDVENVPSPSVEKEFERRAPSLDQLVGPVNLVAPNPVTNAEFTIALAQALHRPAVLPLPAFAARLAFGELADEGLLASLRVLPKKLSDSGFQFKYPELPQALQSLVG